MTRPRIVAGLLVIVGSFSVCERPARAQADAKSQQLILRSGAAMRLDALRSVSVIRIDAKVKTAGLTGTQTQWLGIRRSRFAEYAVLPPLKSDDGYDGHAAWNRDQSGLVWDDGSDAGRSMEIDGAFIATYQLWRKNAGGASVAYRGVRRANRGTYDVLRVMPPDSKLPLELWFDRSTHYLAREVQAAGPVVNVATLSGYRLVHGLMLPFSTHVDNTNGNNSDLSVSNVSFDPPHAASRLLRPRSAVKDAFMLHGRASTTVPVDVVDNHVYVDVMLDGRGPYHLIFDTGGMNVIDPAVAKEIAAFGKGTLQASGVGAKTESFSFAPVASVRIGDAAIRDQIFSVAPVRAGFGIASGRAADGLIGWEVLARYVTTFDYARKRLTLTMPGAAPAFPQQHAVRFVFNGTQPQIPCGIDGIPSECTIDTGARDTMTFYAPYLAAHPQVKPSTLTAAGVTGFGVGGASFGELGRVRSFSVGDLTMSGLIGSYSTSTQGAFANPFVAANLGGNFLRRFTVTFDYPHERMALVPNAAFALRDDYERSGLFVVRAGGEFQVVDARPGTPAAAAGIAKGDVITSIDGAPSASMTLRALREHFSQRPGAVVRLGIKSKAGVQRMVSLTLRNYV